MTAKEYLCQPDHYERLIHAKVAEYLRYQTLSMSTSIGMGSPLGTVVQTSGHKDRVSTFSVAMADARTQVEELMDKYAEMMVTIDEQLKGLIIRSSSGAVVNSDYYDILHMHFLERIPLKDIPERVHLSDSSMYRRYKEALNLFEELYLK